tara:strand:+ start:1696 stop:2610 length:915 start_codon:yes stop_codon:yes gene_type:complete
MMKNLVIAGYSGYNSLEKVENFIESFLKVKLPHDEIIICFSGDETEINKYLDKHLIKQVKLEDVSGSKYVSRFKWFSDVIDTEVYDKVLCADIRDVVFQYNPFTWMFDFKKRPLLVCDEGMKHKDEPWNQMTMQGAFPNVKDEMMNFNVFNVGVLGGDAYYVKSMCKRVFERCLTAPAFHRYNGVKLEVVPDQVAFSILVNFESPNGQNQHLSNKDSWCLTCASVEYSTKEVKVIGGKICNMQGQEYCLVHQYDRWKSAIDLNYNIKTQKFSRHNEEFFKISFECGKHKTLETINESRVSLCRL